MNFINDVYVITMIKNDSVHRLYRMGSYLFSLSLGSEEFSHQIEGAHSFSLAVQMAGSTLSIGD